jgi:hypothetical protein
MGLADTIRAFLDHHRVMSADALIDIARFTQGGTD